LVDGSGAAVVVAVTEKRGGRKRRAAITTLWRQYNPLDYSTTFFTHLVPITMYPCG